MSLLLNLFLLTGLFSLDGQVLADQVIVVSYQDTTGKTVNTVSYTNDEGEFKLELDAAQVKGNIEMYALFPHPYVGIGYRKVSIEGSDGRYVRLSYSTESDFHRMNFNGKIEKSLSYQIELGAVMLAKSNMASTLPQHSYHQYKHSEFEYRDGYFVLGGAEDFNEEYFYLAKGSYFFSAYCNTVERFPGPFYRCSLKGKLIRAHADSTKKSEKYYRESSKKFPHAFLTENGMQIHLIFSKCSLK